MHGTVGLNTFHLRHKDIHLLLFITPDHFSNKKSISDWPPVSYISTRRLMGEAKAMKSVNPSNAATKHDPANQSGGSATLSMVHGLLWIAKGQDAGDKCLSIFSLSLMLSSHHSCFF